MSSQSQTQPVLSIHRDPRDIHMMGRVASGLVILSVALLVSGGFNLWQYWRRPDRIVVDMSSGRVIQINNRIYGTTDHVAMQPDAPSSEDKMYAVKQWADGIWRIDPETRTRDIEKSLLLMVPGAAREYAATLKRDGVLAQQRRESWQATWSIRDATIDPKDPYLLRMIGEQKLTRISGGVPVQDTRQYSLTCRVVADPMGRADRNLRTGFLVAGCDYKLLASGGEGGGDASGGS